MTKADPDDIVEAVEPAKGEAEGDDKTTTVVGPIGVVLGLAGAMVAGLFLTEEGPPAGEAVSESQADASPEEGRPGVVLPSQMGQPTISLQRPPIAPEIVVKFQDSTEIKEICDLFWRDKEAAKERFRAFAEGKPFLQGLHLARATYSNEVVLVLQRPDLKPGSRELRSLYFDATSRLRQSPNIKYAEPNSTAQPGKDTP